MTSPGGRTVGRVDVQLGIDATGARQEAQAQAEAIEESVDPIEIPVQPELTGISRLMADIGALDRALPDLRFAVQPELEGIGRMISEVAAAKAVVDAIAGTTTLSFVDDLVRAGAAAADLDTRLGEVGRAFRHLNYDPRNLTTLSVLRDLISDVGAVARRARGNIADFATGIGTRLRSAVSSVMPTILDLRIAAVRAADAFRIVRNYTEDLLHPLMPTLGFVTDSFRLLGRQIGDIVTPHVDRLVIRVGILRQLMSQALAPIANVASSFTNLGRQAATAARSFGSAFMPHINNAIVGFRLLGAQAAQSIRSVSSALASRVASIQPVVDSAALANVAARIASVTRSSVAVIRPVVDNAAMRLAGTQLARLSGLRVATDEVDKMYRAFRNLDRAIPTIATLTTAIIGMVGWLSTAVSNTFALGASLAQIGPLALALPAALASAGIAIGVMVAAFKDFNSIFPQVAAELSVLQDRISANFWAEATAGVQAFLNAPWQQFQAGLAETATALGQLTGSFASELAAGLDVTPMFASLNTAIGILQGAAKPLTTVIQLLGEAGTAILPLLAEKFVGLAEKFANFLSNKGVGGLTAMFEQAVFQAGELFRALGGLGNILSGIASAAVAGGGSTLTMLADTLDRVAEVVNGPTFQTALTNLFGAAHTAMSAIATVSGPAVQDMFLALAETLTAVLPSVGLTIGTLFDAIASAIADPRLQEGVIAVIDGVNEGLRALAPAIGPVGAAFAELGPFIGELAATFGPVLAAVFTTLAESLNGILPAVQPLIPILGDALIQVVQTLAPVIEQLAAAFATIVEGGVIPLITSALQSLLPVITQLAPIISTALLMALEALTPIFATLAPLVATLGETLGAILVPVMTALGPILELVAGVFARLVEAVAPLITVALELINAVLVPLLPVVMDLINIALIPLMVAFEVILPVVEALGNLLLWVAESIILPIISPIIQGLADLLDAVLGPAIEAIGPIFKALWDFAQGVWEAFRALFEGDLSGFVERITGAIDGFRQRVREIWNQLWSQIGERLSEAWNTFISTIQERGSEILSWFSGLPERIKSSIGDALSMLRSIGQNIVQGLINGLASMGGQLASFVTGFINNNIPGVVRNILGISSPSRVGAGLGEFFIEGLIEGMESQYKAVIRSLRGLTTDMARLDFRAPVRVDMTGLASAVADSPGGVWVQRVLNYYAAPGNSLSSEEDLFAAAGRGRMVWG